MKFYMGRKFKVVNSPIRVYDPATFEPKTYAEVGEILTVKSVAGIVRNSEGVLSVGLVVHLTKEGEEVGFTETFMSYDDNYMGTDPSAKLHPIDPEREGEIV